MSDITAALEARTHGDGSTLTLATLAYQLSRVLDEAQVAAVTPLLKPEAAAALRALFERTQH